jgi:mannose-1-phosphate guanylyltransferase
MAVLTADHYIADAVMFHRALSAALGAARQGFLVTMGINPTGPATGYGYIEQSEELPATDDGLPLYRVARFTEKPDRETAAAMLASGRFSWNSGMFIWKIERIMEEFERQMPALYTQLQQVEAALGKDAYERVIAEVWPQVKKETIDYGVMERARDVAVIPVEMGWTDIGSWGSLIDLLPADSDGNYRRGLHIGLDTHNTLVFGGERLIATIGVRDLIIVDTGDALLVCHKEEEQRVREMVEELKARNMTDLL